MIKIKIVIVDDHALVRDGFTRLLGDLPEVAVLDAVSSGEEALASVTRQQPDVVLMDIMMRGMSGIEATRWIKEQNPSVKVILISGEVSTDLVRDGMRAGIDGYMHKNSTKESVLWALQCVMRGEKYLSKEVTDIVLNGLEEPPRAPSRVNNELTNREQEVLRLLATGKSIREIADQLFISTRTVETHKLNIQSKLNLTNTAQLVRYALEKKMV